MARKKKIIISGTIDREQAEDALARYADADARIQQLTGKMDVQITKIREKYADDLDKLKEIREKAFEETFAYAEDNRDVFGKKKSLEMVHGIIGFRTGTPKLKTLKGYTWAASTKLIKEFLPSFIRTKEEPAKDRLLDERENPEVNQLFKKVGIYVDQDEAFYVEPKKEEIAV